MADSLADRLGVRTTGPWELWLLRVLWLGIPVVAGPVLGQVIDGTAASGTIVVEVAAWAFWFVGLVATLVPHPVSLTGVRILAPSVVGVALLALLGTAQATVVATAAVCGVVLSVLALLPSVGDAMVNGSAYGSERRMALRTPGPTLFGPLQLAWLAVFAGLSGWAVALMAGRPILSGVMAVVGGGLGWLGWRILHQLALRWVVFVPAGFVLHDRMQLRDPVLIPRTAVSTLGPSPIDDSDDLLDLSAGSLGLALEVETRQIIGFDHRQGADVSTVNATNIRFTPTLPGGVLTEARIRGLRIGEPSRQPLDQPADS